MCRRWYGDVAGQKGGAGFHLYSEPLQLGRAPQWAPEVPFVLTNGGQFDISGMTQSDVMLALENANVVVQTSGTYREFLEGVVPTFGADRLVYASAAPIFSIEHEIERVEMAHFSSAERESVFCGNAGRTFGIAS